MNVLVIRDFLDQIKAQFGDNVCLMLCTDGSGVVFIKETGECLVSFDGLDELSADMEGNNNGKDEGTR